MQMIKTSNKKNPWTARVTLPADPLTGKRLKVGASGRTRREASEALEAKLRLAFYGHPVREREREAAEIAARTVGE